MPTALERHRAEMRRLGQPAIERYVAAHPGYALDADQSTVASVTNYVQLGRCGEQRVIFKVFCQDQRLDREVYGLRHWAATGLVPRLLDTDGERLIVISHIPGAFLPRPEEPGFEDVDAVEVGLTLGRATARLAATPMPPDAAARFESRFHQGQRLEAYLREIHEAGVAVHETVPCYGDPIFGRSLAHLGAHLGQILSQERVLYHQDALNGHFEGSRFTGFFDLEMCRVGTEAMQIGSLWYLLAIYDAWRSFAAGYAEASGRQLADSDREAARAFAHAMVWRYITRYGDWHGEGLSEEEMVAERRDAEGYRESILLNESVR